MGGTLDCIWLELVEGENEDEESTGVICDFRLFVNLSWSKVVFYGADGIRCVKTTEKDT